MTDGSALVVTRRVLVVDNDIGVRKTTVELLESAGFDVCAPEGSGHSLIQEARHMLVEKHSHLVVLDVRLFNDNDDEDTAGLDLAQWIAKEYPWVACLLLTGYENFDVARQALANRAMDSGVPLAVDVTLKSQGAASVIKAVQDAFETRVNCCWDLNLKWSSDADLDEVIRSISKSQGAAPALSRTGAISELREQLGRLFPDADMLRIASLPHFEKTSSLSRSRSVLLRVSVHSGESWLQDVAVKIGQREDIKREILNYTQYVEGQIGDYRFTAQKTHAITWYLGGIVYSLMGANLDRSQTLKEYYVQPQNSIQDLGDVFSNLFMRVLRRWYAEPRLVHIHLWEEYRSVLNLSDERLERLGWGRDDEIPFLGLTRKLPNPIKWLERRAGHSDIETCQHTIHGDLHSGNVFIGANIDVWLIDFECTGRGHGLRDFIKLEADIKFNLLQLNEQDLNMFYHFEVALLSQTTTALINVPHHVPPEVQTSDDASRAFNTITHLRQLAASRIRHEDMRDYFWGLLAQTLFVAGLSHLPREARDRAKLSAAMICLRLGNGRRLREPWPPDDLLVAVPQRVGDRPVINFYIDVSNGLHLDVDIAQMDVGGDFVAHSKTSLGAQEAAHVFARVAESDTIDRLAETEKATLRKNLERLSGEIIKGKHADEELIRELLLNVGEFLKLRAPDVLRFLLEGPPHEPDNQA